MGNFLHPIFLLVLLPLLLLLLLRVFPCCFFSLSLFFISSFPFLPDREGTFILFSCSLFIFLSFLTFINLIFLQAEEKQVCEIRRLKNELNRANEKVSALNTQLVTSVSKQIIKFFFFLSKETIDLIYLNV